MNQLISWIEEAFSQLSLLLVGLTFVISAILLSVPPEATAKPLPPEADTRQMDFQADGFNHLSSDPDPQHGAEAMSDAPDREIVGNSQVVVQDRLKKLSNTAGDAIARTKQKVEDTVNPKD